MGEKQQGFRRGRGKSNGLFFLKKLGKILEAVEFVSIRHNSEKDGWPWPH